MIQQEWTKKLREQAHGITGIWMICAYLIAMLMAD